VFVDLTSHSEVHGRLARDTARPDAYRAEVRRNGIDRSYGVDYRSDGAVINASMPLSPGRSFSVPTELIRGTVDQLTAYFSAGAPVGPARRLRTDYVSDSFMRNTT
jgi:hypothetical protein